MAKIIYVNTDFWLKGRLTCKKATKTPQILWGNQNQERLGQMYYNSKSKASFHTESFFSKSSITGSFGQE